MMVRALVSLGWMVFCAACHAPVQTNMISADPAQSTHEIGDLRLGLESKWRYEELKGGQTRLFKLSHLANNVVIQYGNIRRIEGRYDLDSSLTHTFQDRRIPGVIFEDGPLRMIHGIQQHSGGGDSLYMYMEDTTRWKYYQVDGHFRQRPLLDEFLGAMRVARLEK